MPSEGMKRAPLRTNGSEPARRTVTVDREKVVSESRRGRCKRVVGQGDDRALFDLRAKPIGRCEPVLLLNLAADQSGVDGIREQRRRSPLV